MGQNVFIEGSVVATKGNLYSHSISSGGEWHPDDAEIVHPENGVWTILEDTGSIFKSYYVSGIVAAGGIWGQSPGAIVSFSDIYKFTIEEYNRGMDLLRKQLKLTIPDENSELFFQQQHASAFSLLERFLSSTFIRQTCSREDSFHRVLKSGLLQQRFGHKQILNGPDTLEKELLYIDLVNQIVYHRQKAVNDLFRTAFDIEVDLSPLDDALRIRNDIMHRFGYSISGAPADVDLGSMETLLTTIERIVQETIKQILALPIV